MSSKTNKTKLYARALAEIALKAEKGGVRDSAKLAERFLALLVKNGLEKRANEILGLAEDMLLAKQGKSKITFEIARRLTSEHRVMLKEFVKEGDVVKEKINHELIAGVKITINGERQFDNSLKNRLQNIF